MFESEFGTKVEDIVAAISITIFGSLILILLYIAKRFADETVVDDPPSTIKSLAIRHQPPSQQLSIREKRTLFLELTRLECRKITPIPECDEENCEEEEGNDDNDEDDEEEKDESEYYNTRHTADIENHYSISLNSTASESQDCGHLYTQRKRKLVFFTSIYSLNDDVSLPLLPTSSKLPPVLSSSPISTTAPVLPLHLSDIAAYRRETDPPDIDLPDESFYR